MTSNGDIEFPLTFVTKRRTIIGILLAMVLMVSSVRSQSDSEYVDVFQYMSDTSAHFNQGFVMRTWMNSNGILGDGPRGVYVSGYEYPSGSWWGLFSGIWVGAITPVQGRMTPLVTTTHSEDHRGTFPYLRKCETLGYQADAEEFWLTSVDESDRPNRRGFDDDGDGRIDEDELDGHDNDGDWLINRDDLNRNGKPDHGEPNVDEDYGAVSENDVYVAFRDSFPEPKVPLHVPLGIRVFMKSYAWGDAVKEPILPFEYIIVNNGLRTLDSVYVGFYQLAAGGIGSINGYFRELRTAYTYNPSHVAPPQGLTLLGASRSLDSSNITYRWFRSSTTSPGPPGNDRDKYTVMSSRRIDDENVSPNNQDMEMLLCVGPFPRMNPGDTVRASFAVVSGTTLDAGPNSVRNNAAKALLLHSRGYYPPAVPPSPPLRLRPTGNGVMLDWQWRPGDPGLDPMETWDDSNKIVNTLPDTHWRRRDRPAGKSGGGRIFEGFRIWRSTYPVFDEKQFSLIYQFDVNDDLGFEGQTGIQFTYVDSSIIRGKSYWYAVTSVSIPDYTFLDYVTTTGQPRVDTLLSDPAESKVFQNVQRYGAPFMPSTVLGQVKVVPNPYRTDRNYTYEQGGWEGLGRLWIEDRRVVWFIHLPAKCTIRIFSLAGEVIKTISHDDNDRQSRNLAVGQEEFELLSESNRALASGIYIYLVESEFGTQTGKFVVIR